MIRFGHIYAELMMEMAEDLFWNRLERRIKEENRMPPDSEIRKPLIKYLSVEERALEKRIRSATHNSVMGLTDEEREYLEDLDLRFDALIETHAERESDLRLN